jgi:O-antigen ligase
VYLTDRDRWRTLTLATTAGLVVSGALVAAQTISSKAYILLVAALVFGFVLVRAKEPENWCLWAFWMAAPLPMHGFLVRLDPLHGGGALGIYVIAADAPLVLLFVFWLLRRSREAPFAIRRRNYLVAILPFLAWSALSMFYSARPFWAFCEWIRWIKFTGVLYYAAYGLQRRRVEFCVLAMASSVAVQAGLGVAQELFKSNLGLDQLGLFGSAAEQAVRQELVTGSVVFRGSGLTGHPNYLASFLLLMLPVFGLLAIVERHPLKRAVFYATGLIGAGGLLATMSRAAWVGLLVSAVVALILAAAHSVINARRVVVISIVSLSLAGMLALGFYDTIMNRFKSDWSDSWNLRRDLAQSAIAMALDHVVAGVGLNNYTVAYPPYDRSFAEKMIQMDSMITAVHNTLLLVWAEVGTIGLAAYLFFYEAVFVSTLGRLKQMDLWDRALAIGVLCGIVGAMAFDVSEICLWTDVALYVVAFQVGMLLVLERRRPRLSPRVHGGLRVVLACAG